MNKFNIRHAMLMAVIAAHTTMAQSATPAQPAKADEPPPIALMPTLSKEAREKIAADIKQAAEKPTPRTAQGKPDLTGLWKSPGPGPGSFGGAPAVSADGKRVEVTLPPVSVVNQLDNQNVARRLAMVDSRPQYKSEEHKAKAKHNFDNADFEDPAYRCAPPGVPRIGIPKEIVQTGSAVYLLYEAQNRYRIIPTNGAKHDPNKESMPNGDAIGFWQGDTLVVETVNIAEETWFDKDGSYHGPDLRVTERFTRQGNTLRYEVKSEDPWFVKPLEPRPVTLMLGKADEHVDEDYACVEQSLDHMVSKERH